MRTTLDLNDDLARSIKRLAAESHRTLTEVLEELLRAGLERRAAAAERPRVSLPVFAGGTGPAPGLDLDRSGELLTRMDEEAWRAAD